MANLAVEVAGVAFKNPIIPASGVFGYGREYEKLFPLSKLGGIATKGTTGQPRPGNPAPRIAETPSGMLNSVGLQNPGIDAFLERELPNLLTKDTVILANIAGSTIDECVSIAEKLDETDVHIPVHRIAVDQSQFDGAILHLLGIKVQSIDSTTDHSDFYHCGKQQTIKQQLQYDHCFSPLSLRANRAYAPISFVFHRSSYKTRKYARNTMYRIV